MYTDVNRDGNFFGEGDTNGTTNGLPDLQDGWGTLSDGDHVKIKSNQMLRTCVVEHIGICLNLSADKRLERSTYV